MDIDSWLICVNFWMGQTLLLQFPPNMGSSSSSSMCGSMMGSSTGVHPSPPPRLLVSAILPCSEMFAHQKYASTSSWPTMSSSVMLSCGGISLLSRDVVRGGYVARMPIKPSAFPVLPVTSSNLLCLWRMKICKKTFWSTLLLNWTKLCERVSRERHILAFNWCYLAQSKNNSQ